MGVWGLSPQWGQAPKLKALFYFKAARMQPNTQVFLATQVHNYRSLNDAQIRGGGAPLRSGGAELRLTFTTGVDFWTFFWNFVPIGFSFYFSVFFFWLISCFRLH